MAINSTPIVNVISALNATANNNNNITYSVIGQSENILSAEAKIYLASNGVQLCTYTNNTIPSESGMGYLFPINMTQNSANVTWVSDNAKSQWANGKEYYIRIRVLSNSGWSSFSEGQLFYLLSTPTATFEQITSPLTTSSISAGVSIKIASEGVDNHVVSYQMVLIDKFGDISSSSNILYNQSKVNNLSYTFVGLEADGTYKILFNGTTKQGNRVSATSNTFTVQPKISLTGTVSAENVCSEGKIIITFNGIASAETNVIAIERRRTDSTHWVRIIEKYIPTATSIAFTYDDYFAQCGKSYVYRAVPIYRQGDYDVVGGASTTSATVESFFRQVYITDGVTSFSLFSNVANNTITLNQQVESINPLGSKYPFIVKNARTSYQSGNISGMILPTNFESERDVMSQSSRYNMVTEQEKALHFFTNGTPKVLKDWNGRIWIVAFVGTPNISLEGGSDMSLGSVAGDWVEIGDVEDTDSLAMLGLSNSQGNSSIATQSYVILDGTTLVIVNRPNITLQGNVLDIVQGISINNNSLVISSII